MAFDNFRTAYKAGAESAHRMPTWAAVIPFFLVGIVDVIKAVHKHDLGDTSVSALIWWVGAPLWMWWTRPEQ